MNSKARKLMLTGALLLTTLGLGMSSKSWSQNAVPDSAKATPGRYQMMLAGSGVDPTILLLDTQTGRFWVKGGSLNPWIESSPNFAAPVQVDQEPAQPKQ